MKDFRRGIGHQIRQRKTIYLLCYSLLILVGFILSLLPESESSTLWESAAFAVGASLIATGIAGCTLFLYVSGAMSETRRLDSLLEAGVETIFEEGRSVAIRDEYDRRLAKARKSIDVLGFGLRHLREDYADDFAEWGRRAKVRLLLIDPEFPSMESPYAHQRDAEERDNVGKISSDVKQLIEKCQELMTDDGVNFELKLYTCLPSINIFRIDDEVFWGPYFVGDVSRNMPTLLFKGSSVIAKRVVQHFDQIWDDPKLSRDVPEAWSQDDA